ncbi:MAG: polysaccharide deacetylase family protein [Oscillospiraceae bacterium]|nr:polysaccharide deacetylase family protein [Oscillospiraceae bacterium]
MRYFIITKKQIMVTLSVIVAVALTAGFTLNVFAKQNRRLPIYCVQNDAKKIAISFDAAWGNDDTGTLIDILANYNVKATFFVVAEWVDKYPESVKQLSDAGHQIQNHSSTHPHMPKLSKEQMIEELKNCNEKIAKITGQTPTLFRCPFGDYNNAVVETVENLDMYTIQWDVDSRDWQESATVETITNYVVNKVKDGSIVLFHNDADNTPAALPGILEQLIAKGYTFELISNLIYKENYHIDHAGMQIPNTETASEITSSMTSSAE